MMLNVESPQRRINLTLIRDTATGKMVVEGLSAEELDEVAGDLVAPPRELNCARPLDVVTIVRATVADVTDGPALRVHKLYHGSVVEGPGRRSVLMVSGCSVRCPGCYVKDTWETRGGGAMSVAAAVAALLDPVGEPRDGVTLLGGEPLDQPDAVAELMRELKARGQHIVLYSGYTLEVLARRSEPSVREALCLADILIDGPFVPRLSDGAGEWRGSRNQRVIPLPGLWV